MASWLNASNSLDVAKAWQGISINRRFVSKITRWVGSLSIVLTSDQLTYVSAPLVAKFLIPDWDSSIWQEVFVIFFDMYKGLHVNEKRVCRQSVRWNK